MSNRQYFEQHGLIAGVAGTTTVSLPVAGANQKLILTHVSVVNDTTAMTKVQIQKIIGADTVVVSEQVGPTVLAATYWYHHEIVNDIGEHVHLVMSGTLLNDVIRYYVEGYRISDTAWESENT